MPIGFGIDRHESLVEQSILCGPDGRVDYEVRAGLSARFRGAVDQDARLIANAQVDSTGMGVGDGLCSHRSIPIQKP